MPNKEELDLINATNLIAKRLLDCKKRFDLLDDNDIRCFGLQGYIDGLQFALDCNIKTLLGKGISLDLINATNLIAKRLLDCKKRFDLLDDNDIRCFGLQGYIDGLQFAFDCNIKSLLGKEISKDEN